MIIGNIIKDIVSAAAITDFPNDKFSNPAPRTNIVSTNKPKTTDGTTAKLEMFTLMNFVNQFSLAYSTMYIAVPTPRMIDIRAIVIINQSVPINAPLIPALLGVVEEKLVKKSTLRCVIPFLNISNNKIANTTKPISVQIKNTLLITLFFISLVGTFLRTIDCSTK